MTSSNPRPRTLHVTLAAAVIVILAGLLGARLLARDGNPPVPRLARSSVPASAAVELADLEVPAWGTKEAESWRLTFKTDLDLLAPLGTGTTNAAEWFVDFRKPDGPRYDEAVAAMDRRIDIGGELKQVLSVDDPLLAEAEPWCDQATMRFYYDILENRGYATQIPNLLLPLAFAKSWVARGLAAEDPEVAMADFRRAIRLGRLLRQEDVVVITDLVGLACIRFGAQGIFQVAQSEGNMELALVASIVLGEVAPQRLLTAQRLTQVTPSDFVSQGPDGQPRLELPEVKLDAIVTRANEDPDQRIRIEAILVLNLIRFFGPPEHQEQAVAQLAELEAGADDIVSAVARWSLESRPEDTYIEEYLKAM